jgi:protease I
MTNILVVLAPEKFQDDEFFIPKHILESAKIKITTTSLEKIAESTEEKIVKIDILLTDVKSEDYDAILIVGGPGAITYIDNPTIHKLINDFNDEKKLISAICISPATLARAGVLINKQATIWNGKKEIFKETDVEFVDEPVVIDENIITANGPEAAEEFAKAIIDFI